MKHGKVRSAPSAASAGSYARAQMASSGPSAASSALACPLTSRKSCFAPHPAPGLGAAGVLEHRRPVLDPRVAIGVDHRRDPAPVQAIDEQRLEDGEARLVGVERVEHAEAHPVCRKRRQRADDGIDRRRLRIDEHERRPRRRPRLACRGELGQPARRDPAQRRCERVHLGVDAAAREHGLRSLRRWVLRKPVGRGTGPGVGVGVGPAHGDPAARQHPLDALRQACPVEHGDDPAAARGQPRERRRLGGRRRHRHERRRRPINAPRSRRRPAGSTRRAAGRARSARRCAGCAAALPQGRGSSCRADAGGWRRDGPSARSRHDPS